MVRVTVRIKRNKCELSLRWEFVNVGCLVEAELCYLCFELVFSSCILLLLFLIFRAYITPTVR